MIIQLDSRSGVPIYRQVMEQVTRAIMSGQISVGQQLESVSEMARRLKVNPMTVSKAYAFLVEEELLERRAGVGLFVRSVVKDKKRQIQDTLLSSTLNKAAALTIQLGLDEAEACQLFVEHFKKNKIKHQGIA